jgi:hypothetical protein
LLSTFNKKAKELSLCSEEIQKVLRFKNEQISVREIAREFFGTDRVSYVAIDGTEDETQRLDILVFYTGAFGYLGDVTFGEETTASTDPVNLADPAEVSTAVPLTEENFSSVLGKQTEAGIEIDLSKLPSSLMRFAEYFLAWKTVETNNNVRIIIMDRTISADIAHTVWKSEEFLESGKPVLQEIETLFGKPSNFDLELARLLVPNKKLEIPPARSHLLRYVAINKLFEKELSPLHLLQAIGAETGRLEKLEKILKKWDAKYGIFESKDGNYKLKDGVSKFWDRVFAASHVLANHIFEPGKDEHPLRITIKGKEKWISADDIDYLTLIFAYALLKKAWEKRILLIGIAKDTGASELTSSVLKTLNNAGILKLKRKLPAFTSDKVLLQTNSIINCDGLKTPWRTFEYDVCFRTIAPEDKASLTEGQAFVKGNFKNVISTERMFVKAYVQLWSSKENPLVRSYVFAYDRPCYPEYDCFDEVELLNEDSKILEKILPVVHLKHESKVAHLTMGVLESMCKEVVPEALGHNYPLFLADKKAKAAIQIARAAFLAAVDLEMARNTIDHQSLFGPKFREYRRQIESKRRMVSSS